MESTILCPVWCNRPLGHEYEDVTRAGEPLSHHVREVLKVPASFLGDPCELTLSLFSTEAVILDSDGVSVTATPPAIWLHISNLKTLEASGCDLDPANAGFLGETLNRNVRTLLDSL
jgi:hypothetical protein